jgi:ABC-type transport system involved in multi-copper enzyme maturation permease subunit
MPHFDPEQYARPLSVAGTLAVVTGLYSGADAGWAVAAAGVALLLTACYSRRDGFLLFGPFARADAMRIARSRRTHLVRAGVVLAAGAIIFLASQAELIRGTFVIANGQSTYYSQYVSQNEKTDYVTLRLLKYFAITIGVVVPTLAVLIVSGVIADERSAKRWDILLTTDLRGREIVFGKLLVKLWLVIEPVLVLVPVLAILPLIVGVSPKIMLLYGTTVVLTALALAGLAGLASSFDIKRVWAIIAVFGVSFCYFDFSFLCVSFYTNPEVWDFPNSLGWNSPFTVEDFVRVINAANPITTNAVQVHSPPRAPFGKESDATVMGRYAAATLGIFLTGTLWASRRIRKPRGLRNADGPPSRASRQLTTLKDYAFSRGRFVKARPPVTDEPLAWWTQCRFDQPEPAAKRHRVLAMWFGGSLTLCLGCYLFDSVGQLTVYPLINNYFRTNPWPLGNAMRAGIDIGMPFALICYWIGTLYFASSSVAIERSGNTLDSLRMSPLSSREMLTQIFTGCTRGNRFLISLWGSLTIPAVLTGFFPAVGALVLLVLTLLVGPPLIGFALYCSVWASTPTRAVRNLVFGGAVFHAALLIAGLFLFFTTSNLLSVDVDQLLDFRTDPWEFVSPGSTRPTYRSVNGVFAPIPRTIEGDLITLGIAAVIVVLYSLIGRWVFNRAVNRFNRTREATA